MADILSRCLKEIADKEYTGIVKVYSGVGKYEIIS